MKLRYVYTLLLSIVLLSSCWMSTNDLVEQTYEEGVTVNRYDRLQNEYVRFNSFTALQKMNTTYSKVTQMLVEEVLDIGEVNDDHINEKIRAYYSDTTLLHLMDDVENRFVDLSQLEKDLTKGFKKLKKEVPAIVVPHVYTQISALNESIIVADSLLGISLDKYMGEDYPLYQRYYYDYQRRSMRPDRIVPDCFIFYLQGQYPFPFASGRTLLERMLHQGQIFYAAQQILNLSSVADIIGYSDVEKKWWKENRNRVWEYIKDKQLLDVTDPMFIRSFLFPSFSSLTEIDGPSSIGIYLGAEIIASYMKNHRKISLEELLSINDYYMILAESSFAL